MLFLSASPLAENPDVFHLHPSHWSVDLPAALAIIVPAKFDF